MFSVTALRKLVLAGASFCIALGSYAAGPVTVDAAALTHANAHPDAWMSVGRTYSEQRYSPLDQINAGNVGELGLAWSHDMDSRRGLEATPLVVNGVMYTTGTWSRVYALNAKTGKLLWSYDPKVPRAHAVDLCCDVVNRGVALWQGRVFFGTLDGRLIALDAKTGKLDWSVVTVEQSKPYSITGAPRVIDGKVIIGNGGAEFAGVRGYLSAYDVSDGKMLWRFYTVPGNPADNKNSPALQAAVKTWSKPGWWRLGGGGPVWNDMAYDPKLNLLYFGTGNANPWNRYVRNAKDGSGDNLYTASIMAIDPDTGKYVWHFQTTPGDSWDYDSDEHLILADIRIDGKLRSVVMQANKNGFFYVLDRKTGAFISGTNFVTQNWAKGLVPKTGRPILAQAPYGGEQGKLTWPSPFGAHNWQAGSFSPKTGLVYIPAADIPFLYKPEKTFTPPLKGWDTGLNLAAGALPPGMDPLLQAALIRYAVAGKLIAWNPATQTEAWHVDQPMPWNGGTLATAGNLVFEGTADGRFVAYKADDGALLWQHKLPNGVIAAPMTYSIDGTQYVAVMMGWGGSFALAGGQAAYVPGRDYTGRLLVFKLGGDATLPTARPQDRGIPAPPPSTAGTAQIAAGSQVFNQHCAVCHGQNAVSGSAIPDLRYLPAGMYGAGFKSIVLGGALTSQGMASFASVVSPKDVDDIQAYLIKRAQETRASLQQPSWWAKTKSFFYWLIAPPLNWYNAFTH